MCVCVCVCVRMCVCVCVRMCEDGFCVVIASVCVIISIFIGLGGHSFGHGAIGSLSAKFHTIKII